MPELCGIQDQGLIGYRNFFLIMNFLYFLFNYQKGEEESLLKQKDKTLLEKFVFSERENKTNGVVFDLKGNSPVRSYQQLYPYSPYISHSLIFLIVFIVFNSFITLYVIFLLCNNLCLSYYIE